MACIYLSNYSFAFQAQSQAGIRPCPTQRRLSHWRHFAAGLRQWIVGQTRYCLGLFPRFALHALERRFSQTILSQTSQLKWWDSKRFYIFNVISKIKLFLFKTIMLVRKKVLYLQPFLGDKSNFPGAIRRLLKFIDIIEWQRVSKDTKRSKTILRTSIDSS